jgi:hypothetical protein
MTAFPDMVVSMISINNHERHVVYRWTLIGTNPGPSGTGSPVVISGFEEWTIDPAGQIAASQGRFDEADCRRQSHADSSAVE